MDCNVKKMTASMTNTANKRDEIVKRADILSAQLAASVCLESTYKPVLIVVKEALVKTFVERANLQQLVNYLVAKVRKAFADLGGALQSVVKSMNRLSEDVDDKIKTKIFLACKQKLFLLDIEYAGALRRSARA